MNRVVADTEHARVNQPADPYEEAADGGPPHPVNRQSLKQILKAIDERRQDARSEARDDADYKRGDESLCAQRGVRVNRENGTGAEKWNS